MKNFALYLGVAASVALASSPAFAGVPIPVPEPGALSIIGGVAVAALIGRRFIRRK